MRIGVIGLGAMGRPIAENLHKAGHAVTVFNRTAARAASCVAMGMRSAETPRACALDADALLVNISDTPDVSEVLFAEQTGAIHGLKSGAMVLDCSTIAPAAAREHAERLRAVGVGYVDAPVSGGPEGAARGTLAIMCGGSAEDFHRALPVLQVLGQRIVHVGPAGSGQIAKAVNQVVIAGTYQALAEGLSLAAGLGADATRVLEAISGGAARSWVLENRAGNMLRDDYPAGFKVRLHRKDLGIALNEGRAAGVPLALSELVAAREDRLIANGLGDLDVSALARCVREDAHQPKGPFPTQELR